MSLTFLGSRRLAAVQAESPGSRVRHLALTAAGQQARDKYFHLLPEIEKRWETCFGEKPVRALRTSLETLTGMRAALFRALEPYKDGWRAEASLLETLPHYPMVLHRGGYPDGS